jgi:hypothetical protein
MVEIEWLLDLVKMNLEIFSDLRQVYNLLITLFYGHSFFKIDRVTNCIIKENIREYDPKQIKR